jgi:hypothetical protein
MNHCSSVSLSKISQKKREPSRKRETPSPKKKGVEEEEVQVLVKHLELKEQKGLEHKEEEEEEEGGWLHC